VQFIDKRVAVLPSFTRFGVQMIGAGIGGLLRVVGPQRTVALVTSKPIPLVAEFPRLIRSLGYAFIWETWPDTGVDGSSDS
jgi:hypothetical protein